MNNNNNIAIIKVDKAEYPKSDPFDPDFHYPEYPFGGNNISFSPNYVYRGIRETFRVLGLDAESYGKPEWNPLGDIISPGERVVLKPNFVMHENRSGHSVEAVITHGSIIRAVVDYVLIALKSRGEVYIIDAPQYDADYEKIIDVTGTRQFVDVLKKRTYVPIILADLRVEQAIEKDGLVISRKKLAGDPNGYIAIDLGEKSFYKTISNKNQNYRGSDYDGIETVNHHNFNKHEYLISRTVLNSDVFINIPKLKTHRKTGVTLSLKNLIGINGDKNWIPHFRLKGPLKDGDEHSSLSELRDFECLVKDGFKSFVYRSGSFGICVSRQIRKMQKALVEHTNVFDIRGGSWYGNDTLWRSVLDLNRILFYANKDGNLRKNVQRKYLCIIDGVIGGQGDGPYHTLPADSACILAGVDPLSIDLVAIQFMGFDYKKIPKVFEALKDLSLFPDSSNHFELVTNNEEWKTLLSEGKFCYRFQPAFSWKGHIELDSSSTD